MSQNDYYVGYHGYEELVKEYLESLSSISNERSLEALQNYCS